MIRVFPTSSRVDRPRKSDSLPPGMATPYWCNLVMSLRTEVRLSLRTVLAHDVAQNSPLRISRGTSLPGFSMNMPPDPRIHLPSLVIILCQLFGRIWPALSSAA
eukprot:15720609-Heterocapsa_arctica.AAC.1